MLTITVCHCPDFCWVTLSTFWVLSGSTAMLSCQTVFALASGFCRRPTQFSCGGGKFDSQPATFCLPLSCPTFLSNLLWIMANRANKNKQTNKKHLKASTASFPALHPHPWPHPRPNPQSYLESHLQPQFKSHSWPRPIPVPESTASHATVNRRLVQYPPVCGGVFWVNFVQTGVECRTLRHLILGVLRFCIMLLPLDTQTNMVYNMNCVMLCVWVVHINQTKDWFWLAASNLLDSVDGKVAFVAQNCGGVSVLLGQSVQPLRQSIHHGQNHSPQEMQNIQNLLDHHTVNCGTNEKR